MNTFSIINKKTAIYYTGDNIYIINKLDSIYEISEMSDCRVIGYTNSMTDAVEFINDYRNGAGELIPC